MIKWPVWRMDLLLGGLVALTLAFAITGQQTQWVGFAMGLVLFLCGYFVLRPHLSFENNETVPLRDYLGSIILIAGLSVSSYYFSESSMLLSVACPAIWFIARGLLRSIIANVVMIVIVGVAIGLRSFNRGTLREDWIVIVASALTITVFSIMIGSMVHAVIRWGFERAELLEDLQASQANLAESYQQLLASTTLTPVEESPLSARETEVLELVSQGCTNSEIARRLFISTATVKTHMEHILTKLGATTRTQAVLVAYQEGLLSAANDT